MFREYGTIIRMVFPAGKNDSLLMRIISSAAAEAYVNFSSCQTCQKHTAHTAVVTAKDSHENPHHNIQGHCCDKYSAQCTRYRSMSTCIH